MDGYATTQGGTTDNPMGEDWNKFIAAYVATRTFRERVLHDNSGDGTTGVDDRCAAEYFDGVGVEIMGVGMFGFHTFPHDAYCNGWWGDEPPFRVPVFVLTHRERDSIDLAGGTTFPFRPADPYSVLEHATVLADGKEVRVGAASAPCGNSSKLVWSISCTS